MIYSGFTFTLMQRCAKRLENARKIQFFVEGKKSGVCSHIPEGLSNLVSFTCMQQNCNKIQTDFWLFLYFFALECQIV